MLAASATSLAAADGTGGHGTYRGRVVSEYFQHRQAERRDVVPQIREQSQNLRPDIGEIAVIDGSNGVVSRPNFLDLRLSTIELRQTTDGWVGAAQELAFDEAAEANGIPLGLGDDDATLVELPFEFPYFGETHRQVWVHSDGNLTFEEPDAVSTARSFARAASGPPRIAPFFADLDPSRIGAQVRSYRDGNRAVFTWDGVPFFTTGGNGARQTFQAELRSDGTILFHLSTINSTASIIVGVFEGRLLSEPAPVDFSEGFTTPEPSGGAEIFTLSSSLDIFSAAQRFYRNHDDAYDFIVLFNNTGLPTGPGVFAFEVNIRNEILGIGDIFNDGPTGDFGPATGSERRLVSFMNMGPLSQYPMDPTTNIPLIGENNTVSVMSHEAGHRWGAYLSFVDPQTGRESNELLGRQEAHWSFYLNTDASFLEGNRIEDLGAASSPRFATTQAVAQFGPLDLYIMGLIPPEAFSNTFFVVNPTGGGSPSRARPPQSGVTFDGERREVTLDMIVAAEGPRIPDVSLSEKQVNFAFVLLVDEDSTDVPAEDTAKLDTFRTAFESFFELSTGDRIEAETDLKRQLELSARPAAGVLVGGQGMATLTLAEPLDEDLIVSLGADASTIDVPGEVVIPAGETGVEFAIGGLQPGTALLTATPSGPGFDSPQATILTAAASTAGLTLEVVSGAGQSAAPGTLLPEPVVIELRDANRLRYSGAALTVEASADGVVESAGVTDEEGRLQISWTLASTPGPNALTVSVGGLPGTEIVVDAGSTGDRPAFSAAGVVNAASLGQGGAAPHVALSPGGLISIFGEDLSPEQDSAQDFPLPRSLADVQVRINGAPAPLLLVSEGQINAQTPIELVGATEAEIRVTSPSGESDVVVLPLASTQPGVFFDPDSGIGALRFAADGQTAWTRAARAGEFVEIFGTGFGPVDQPLASGEPASGFFLARTLEEVVVLVDGVRLEPTFSGLAPLFAGLYQVNVQLPADLAPGRHELQIEAAGLLSNAVPFDVE